MTSEPTFNPAYRVARCGQQGDHQPHVMESGPDQPRNCPGTGPTFGEMFAEALAAADHRARLAAGTEEG